MRTGRRQFVGGILKGGILTDARLYENLIAWIPNSLECSGDFNIPQILPEALPSLETWLPFNYCMSGKISGATGLHMFVDDSQIVRLWKWPTRYVEPLRRAACVCTPDFSLYTDVPKVLNMYNHYRKHWLGAYWQRQGLKVIPTICWSDEDSFAWCFDGEPTRAVVAVSSVGTQRRAETREAFMRGYDAMLERLQPSSILFHGKVPTEARGNIVQVEAFQDQMSRRCKR